MIGEIISWIFIAILAGSVYCGVMSVRDVLRSDDEDLKQ